MTEGFVAVAILLAPLLIYINVRTTRYVWRGEPLGSYRIVMTGSIWLVPFVGALLARAMAAPPVDAGEVNNGELPPGTVDEPALAELHFGAAPPFALLENMGQVRGLPLLDWSAVADWTMQVADPAEQRAALDQAKRAWLLHMRDALGEGFYLLESEHAYLLSSLEPKVALATTRYIATTRKRIGRVLDGVARFEAEEKSILLVVEDEETYYDYVTAYYPAEGEFAFSGGMFINAGCPHFVVRRADLSMIEPVIAHELTHSAVHHLPLPLWVDEGLAVNTEHRLAGTRGALYTPQELRQKHLAFWGEAEIQEFWSGASFRRSDDGNMLSYDLARIMIEQMGRDWAAFSRFVSSAQRQDAGLAAARESLGVDLPAFVCGLLDREPDVRWAPDFTAWNRAASAAESGQTQ